MFPGGRPLYGPPKKAGEEKFLLHSVIIVYSFGLSAVSLFFTQGIFTDMGVASGVSICVGISVALFLHKTNSIISDLLEEIRKEGIGRTR